ncbi:MAG: hypothetical protein M3480_01135 [Verrucomicrobiota bacterium]|nr:hypothetical protein [Verrucomicrobiota bacterium]
MEKARARAAPAATFGGKIRWTVVLPDGFQKKQELTTKVIHASDVTSLNYDHVFAYNPEGALLGVHSRSEAAAIAQAGGFPQFTSLPRTPSP